MASLKQILLSPIRAFASVGEKAAAAAMAFANALPYIPNWLKIRFIAPTFQRLARDGYKRSAVVFSCIQKYGLTFPEPPLIPFKPGTDERLTKHPVLDLIRRPNQWMSQARFMCILITYMLIGGDAYVLKLRSVRDNHVIGMRLLHAGQVTPVPTVNNYIDHYLFTIGDGTTKEVSASDIIQIQWPSVDPDEPWKAYAPLLAVAREIDTTAEIATYTYGLFANDATPRTAISFPAGATIGDKDYEKIKARAEERFGGENRGSIAVLRGGATITRIGLNLRELDFANVLDVPEAHIASTLGVPPVLVGLNVGLKRSTFANYEEARTSFAEDVLCPLWKLVADALTNGLLDEFIVPFELRYDLTRVTALRENVDIQHKQTMAEWTGGLITRNEARIDLDYAPLEEDDLGDVFYYQVTPGGQIVPPLMPETGSDPAAPGSGQNGGTDSGNQTEEELQEEFEPDAGSLVSS